MTEFQITNRFEFKEQMDNSYSQGEFYSIKKLYVHYVAIILKNSRLFHKARKCHFASASTVCGAEASAVAPQVQALAKHFLAIIHNFFFGRQFI
jgi:hypothetical protein